MSKQKFTKEGLKDKLDGNELDLSLCNLSKVPVREIASLPKATALDLSCNILTILPPTFSTLTKLIKLDLSKNNLTELPLDFGRLVNLERLDLYQNELTTLPISFVQLKRLKWLDLKGNPIQTLLPDVVGNCLSAEECKQCANGIISYLKKKNSEQERIKQKKLQDEREKNAAEQAIAQKGKELRKRQKILEKEERRKAFEEMEKQKKLKAQEAEEKSIDNNYIEDESPTKVVKEKKGNSLMFILIIFGILVGICGLVFYCEKNNYFNISLKQK